MPGLIVTQLITMSTLLLILKTHMIMEMGRNRIMDLGIVIAIMTTQVEIIIQTVTRGKLQQWKNHLTLRITILTIGSTFDL